MMRDTIHICHRSGDTHFLTPDPAWSRYSHGIGVCIRDEEFASKQAQPIADAFASAASRLFGHLRPARGLRA